MTTRFDRFQQLEPETLRRVGAVAVGWGCLESILCAVCKRFRMSWGEALELGHGDALKKITESLPKSLPQGHQEQLKDLVDRIGKFRDEGRLYYRRNAAMHAIWRTTADGQEVGHRVGYTAQDQTSPGDLDDALVAEIIEVGQELLHRSCARAVAEVSVAPEWPNMTHRAP